MKVTALPPVRVFLRKYTGDSAPNLRNVLCRRYPDDRPIPRKSGVNDDVAKRRDVSPFDMGMACPKRIGKPGCFFPDDRRFVQDRAAQ